MSRAPAPAARLGSLVAWAVAAGLYALLEWGIGPPNVSAFSPRFRLTQLQYFAEHALMGAVALLVVAPAVVGDHTGGQVRALLRSRPAAFLGLVSYGIFLWHGPLVRELVKARRRRPADRRASSPRPLRWWCRSRLPATTWWSARSCASSTGGRRIAPRCRAPQSLSPRR